MHVPKELEIKDIAIIENFIKKNGFATLNVKTDDYLVGTHIPIELEINSKEAKNKGYRPYGHCMKNNYQKLKNGII